MRTGASLRRLALAGIVVLATTVSAAEEGRTLPPEKDLADARLVALVVADDCLSLAEETGHAEAIAALAAVSSQLPYMSDEDAAVLVPMRDQLVLLDQRINELRDALAATDSGGIGPRFAPGKSAGLPDPQWSVICGDRDLNDDALFASLMVFEAANLVKDLVLDGCNQTVIVPILFGCVGGNGRLACIVTDTVFNVAEIVFKGLLFCDEQVASDEATAIYERMQHLHDDLEKMAVDLDFIRKMLACVPVVPLRTGSGCNGTDDDCDTPKVIDECDEDVYGPSVVIQAAVTVPWYRNVAEARAAVEAGTIALDDCQSVTVSPATFSGACGAVTASITATDRCGNSTTSTATVKIDGSLPHVLIPPSIGGTCFASVDTAVATILQQAIVEDDCTPRDQLVVKTDASLEGCELRVRITATNLAGMVDDDAVSVRIDPNPPVIEIDQSVSIPWYRSTGEALDAVIRATHVVDDCQVVTVPAPTLTGTCGVVVARVTVEDQCGNRPSAQATVHVDLAAPTITFPGNFQSQCYATIDAAEQAVRSQMIVNDDCTSRNDLAVQIRSSVTECALRVMVDATDLAGRHASAGVTLRVDAVPPTVVIDELVLGFRGEPLGFQTPKCFATTAAAEAAVLAATRASDGCSSGAALVKSVSSTGSPCALQVTAKATDSCGFYATDKVTVRVDPAAPTVTATVVTNRLTPSDKRMVDVGLAVTVTDGCETGIIPVVTVTSDESSWNGGTSPAPDAEILRDASGALRGVRLRAEALSPGDGRVYRIGVRATDACGNAGTAFVIVNVPNASNQNVDSGQYFDAAGVN